MQTSLSAEFRGTEAGTAAENILRSCVHCGFCNATCPTYQLLGDELDGPRGRIYLIKQMLEGGAVGRSTQVHLDRCLTCLNCETTCPSGVEYGKLVTIGRALVEERVTRPWPERAERWLLREGLTSALFGPLLRMGQAVRKVLPRALRKHVPLLSPLRKRAALAVRAPAPAGAAVPVMTDTVIGVVPALRSVLLLAGCVQPTLRPDINAATQRVLAACGIEVTIAGAAGCCGAVREHLGDEAGGRDEARRNIDAWWPFIEGGLVQRVVANASACGLAVKHYGDLLAKDPVYRDKALRVSTLAVDLSELLPELLPSLRAQVKPAAGETVAVHAPCTLQHGQRLPGVASSLASLGFAVRTASSEHHLCCGSAGTYSVLQPVLAEQLRDRKLAHLTDSAPTCIASANIGCILHLQSGTALPVRHWIEIIDDAL